MNDNWIKTSMVKPKEGATCLVTTQGDIALAKYSEGYFTQYGNDDVSYNNVTAWQYADAPFEDETSKYKKAINELYLYKNYGSICDTDLKPPLTKEDIGSLIVVLCELGDFRNCEFIRIERYDETIQEITEEINNYRNRFI